MIWKNIEIFNIAELIELEDGAVTWRRVPEEAEQTLEKGDQSLRYSRGFTGVELRFRLKGDQVVIRMAKSADDGVDNSFQIYRGGFQGPYGDYAKSKTLCTMEPEDIVISRLQRPERLEQMAELHNTGWDPEVIRIRFDRGQYKLYDVIGDVEPVTREQCPEKTILVYGSSISVGMDGQNCAISWPSHLANILQTDLRNMSFAGSCMLEPKVCQYLGDLEWDMALLELGINASSYPVEKIWERSRYILEQVAGRHPDKPVVVISPFYSYHEVQGETDTTANWRKILPQVAAEYPNVRYLNGLDILGDVRWLTADCLHPSIYGQIRIAQQVYDRIKDIQF